MIPLVEINRFSDHFNVPAETIEKDYMISWILLCLSKSKLKDFFIFYGGTAIKRIYFEEHRFSEDIDLLSPKKFMLDQILEELVCLQYAKKASNLLLNINENSIIYTNNRVQLFINYPGYEEIIGAPKEIRLDFSMDMDLFGIMEDKRIIETYSDMKMLNARLNVMSLNTIFANKLGMLLDITRNEPRDLFDIWFLLNRIDKFDYDFSQMRNAFKERLGFYPSTNLFIGRLNNLSLRKNWNTRLNKQMSELPDITNVIDDVTVKLREIFD